MAMTKNTMVLLVCVTAIWAIGNAQLPACPVPLNLLAPLAQLLPIEQLQKLVPLIINALGGLPVLGAVLGAVLDAIQPCLTVLAGLNSTAPTPTAGLPTLPGL